MKQYVQMASNHDLLQQEKLDELFEHLFVYGCVECSHEKVKNFIDDLGELLHYGHFKHIKTTLKNSPEFKQKFKEKIRAIIL